MGILSKGLLIYGASNMMKKESSPSQHQPQQQPYYGYPGPQQGYYYPPQPGFHPHPQPRPQAYYPPPQQYVYPGQQMPYNQQQAQPSYDTSSGYGKPRMNKAEEAAHGAPPSYNQSNASATPPRRN